MKYLFIAPINVFFILALIAIILGWSVRDLLFVLWNFKIPEHNFINTGIIPTARTNLKRWTIKGFFTIIGIE